MPPRRKHATTIATAEQKKPAATPTSIVVAATNDTTLYTIVNTADRGRIVIAARDIAIGTIIHTETPLAIWPPPPPPSSPSSGGLSQRMITLATSWCTKHQLDAAVILYPLHCLFALSSSARDGILQLHAPDTIPAALTTFFIALHDRSTPSALGLTSADITSLHRLASIINANAYAIGHGHPPPIAMYAFVPLLNHSCAPTCWRVALRDGTSIIRAIQPIKAGEEITMSYLSPTRDLLRPTHQRRATLLQERGFRCNCQRCCQPSDIMRAFTCAHCHARVQPPSIQHDDHDEKKLSALAAMACRTCSACNGDTSSIWLHGFTAEQQGEITWREYESLIWPRFKLVKAVDKLSSLINTLEKAGLHSSHWLLLELRSALRDICAADDTTYSMAVILATQVVKSLTILHELPLPTASGPPRLVHDDDTTSLATASTIDAVVAGHTEWAWAALSLAHEQLADAIITLHRQHASTNTASSSSSSVSCDAAAHYEHAAIWQSRAHGDDHDDTRTLRHKAATLHQSLSSTSTTVAATATAAVDDIIRCSAVSCDQPGINNCARCRRVSYCSKACQKAHWSAHKPSCVAPPS